MLPRSQGLKDLLQQEVRAHIPRGSQQRRVYFRVIHAVMRESDLLKPANYSGRDGATKLRSMVQALARIAINCNHSIRGIEGWCCDRVSAEMFEGSGGEMGAPISKNLNVQFHSLLRHLFAKYPIPRFLDKVWFAGGDGIKVFLRLAKGASVRQCGLPFRLSKTMAHQFQHAPDDLTIWQAIRWAQVLSLGGSHRLARLILKTRLVEQQDDEPFWHEVIEFLCRSEQAGLVIDSKTPVIVDEEIQQVIDFAFEQRFCPASQVIQCGSGHQLPLQPNFTLKRRTLRWFRRHYVNWRNEVEMPVDQTRQRRACGWLSTGLAGFSVEMDGFTWSMEELLSAHELQVEGGIMQHCVGTYTKYCLNGSASIWSMRVMQGEQKKRVLTVEICPVSKRVVQAQGKRNTRPTATAYRMLKRWAANQNVEMNF